MTSNLITPRTMKRLIIDMAWQGPTDTRIERTWTLFDQHRARYEDNVSYWTDMLLDANMAMADLDQARTQHAIETLCINIIDAEEPGIGEEHPERGRWYAELYAAICRHLDLTGALGW